jgi:hypothetical protein
MPTWDYNFGGVFIHANNALGNLENFQRRQVDIRNDFYVCGFQLVKSLDTWSRNHNKIIGADFVKVTVLTDVLRELAV